MDKGISKLKSIIIISQAYPFGIGENYLERELTFFKKYFEEVLILPLNKREQCRNLPDEIKLDDFFLQRTNRVKKKIFLSNLQLIVRILIDEYRHTKAKKYFRKNLCQIISEIVMTIELADKFEGKFLNGANNHSFFYSVWMDEGALMLAILKRLNKIKRFSFRLHGYDLYDDRREGGYMPYRYTCFKETENIFIVSKAGKRYLETIGLFTEKLKVNYSGLYDHGINIKQKNQKFFTIVSCSNLIPLKRVHRIIEILDLCEDEILWVHIGDGPARPDLEEKVKRLRSNISYSFKGQLNYSDVMEFYKNHHIDLFIHLSETEGLPLSIVEAMSFGIPAIATDVGGVGEIVNEQNGYLIPADFDNKFVASLISELMSNPSKLIALANEARKFYLKNFLAEKNYLSFVETITGKSS